MRRKPHARRLFRYAARIASCLAAMAGGPVHAMTPDAQCLAAAKAAAQETGVPLTVLLALTLTETGRGTADGAMYPWAWALNQGGDGHWFDTRDEALTYLSDAVAAGTTNIDVGCFQLNYRWHADAFASLEEMIDPEANALYAARHVARLHDETGDWLAAAAAYHSATPEYAERYLKRFEPIYAALEGGVGATAEPGPAADPPEDERPNRFPLLQAGAAIGAGSLVPLDGAARPLIGGS